MEKLVPENLTFSEVGHLPIIKEFTKKIRLVETLDAMVDSCYRPRFCHTLSRITCHTIWSDFECFAELSENLEKIFRNTTTIRQNAQSC